jgi:hypothetical protein
MMIKQINFIILKVKITMKKNKCETCYYHRYLGRSAHTADNGNFVFKPISGFACLEGDNTTSTIWGAYPKNCNRYKMCDTTKDELIVRIIKDFKGSK